jgi:hypothetical protein
LLQERQYPLHITGFPRLEKSRETETLFQVEELRLETVLICPPEELKAGS